MRGGNTRDCPYCESWVETIDWISVCHRCYIKWDDDKVYVWGREKKWVRVPEGVLMVMEDAVAIGCG